MIKEKPIIFSKEMVRAILDGRKTQTRRVIKHPERYENIRQCDFCCPFGQVGDRLWVREAYLENVLHGEEEARVLYRANGELAEAIPWKPSIHMPRWASRITLEIIRVKVEKLQEIELVDIVEEGIDIPEEIYNLPDNSSKFFAIHQYFIDFWDRLNAKQGYGWDTNPWVFVLEFKAVKDDL